MLERVERGDFRQGKEPGIDRVPGLIRRLHAIVGELHEIFPERRFTPVGHLVGDLGECLAAYFFDLELKPPSTKGHDARLPRAAGLTDIRERVTVEIKCTQGEKVGFYDSDFEPDRILVLRLARGAAPTVVYNGRAGRCSERPRESPQIVALLLCKQESWVRVPLSLPLHSLADCIL